MEEFAADGARMSRATIDVDARYADGAWQQHNTVTPEHGEPRRALVTGRFDERGRFLLDTERVTGTGGEAGNCVVVEWSLRADPSQTFAELVSFHGDGERTRTWHRFVDGHYVGSTLLRERRVG
jgi:hypothetical protein